MHILVLGGTRFFGRHLVNALLCHNHTVTVLTRSESYAPFVKPVHKISVDRADKNALAAALHGQVYDIVYDNIAYASEDVRGILDIVQCTQYILTSTTAVYTPLQNNVQETQFNPLAYPLKWLCRADADYAETKRQAECALFGAYPHIKSVAVRFPYVIGPDDYTNRLYFYVAHIIKQTPMLIDNFDCPMGFVLSNEAGAMLAHFSIGEYEGIYNGCNMGSISIADIAQYVQRKTGKAPVLAKDDLPAPYNGTPAYSINTDKINGKGFTFTDINASVWPIIDAYIDKACAESE